MALLGAIVYDPSSAGTDATSSLLAMTAVDTTNLRLTFTAPANGAVLVRIRCVVRGATSSPQIYLGCIENSPSSGTLRGRQAPSAGRGLVGASANSNLVQEVQYVVTGLTPSSSYTWDAAYGVEVVVASSTISYGGPNNATVNDAWGAFVFEIWEAENLAELTASGVASIMYDPNTAVTKATTAALAMTAFDTTNLRLAFDAPASGRALVKVRVVGTGGTSGPNVLLGVLEGSTVKARAAPSVSFNNVAAAAADTRAVYEALIPVTGLTPGAALTWDAAYALETVVASTNLKYGGPNDTTTDNAWGAINFEIWAG